MTSSPKRKQITKRDVEALRPMVRDVFIWDTGVKGFGVRCRPSGSKRFFLKYRTTAGRQRWFTIGEYGSPWTVEKARDRARALLVEVANNDDPSDARERERLVQTIAELCDSYIEQAEAGNIVTRLGRSKKYSTIATDKGRINRHIKPLLGRRRIDQVTSGDIKRFLRDVASGKTAADEKTGKHGRAIVRGGRGTASRTVGLLGGIFSYAVELGWLTNNPVRGVRRYRDNKKERFLSPAELSALGTALAGAEGENPYAVAAIRLLMFTGCRKSEILTLRWEWVDFERAMLLLPDSKTGPKIVFLSAPALEILAAIPRQAENPFVICGSKRASHLVELGRAWKRIREGATREIWLSLPDMLPLREGLSDSPTAREIKDAAEAKGMALPNGLLDVRLHDLRHSFASVAAAGGMPLQMIGKLLGHKDPSTTARYAHLAEDPLKAANEAVAESIRAAMSGKGAQVIPFARSGDRKHDQG